MASEADKPLWMRGRIDGKRVKKVAPERYDPLETCPGTSKNKYAGMSEKSADLKRAAAMRLKCLECCGWSIAEVARCEISGCALWPWARKDLLVEVQQNVPLGTG